MSNDDVIEVFEFIETLPKSTAEDTRADEEMWDRQFAESQDQLAKLADAALDEYRAGKTRPCNPQ